MKHFKLHLSAWLVALLLAACGGGGGGGGTTPPVVTPPVITPPVVDPEGTQPFHDTSAYSSAPGGSLAGAEEGAAQTRHRLTLGGVSIAYTARAGHLIVRRPADNAAQASMFYVAYTADAAPAATRPVMFFFNGGPGSASLWLHIGSYGPRRVATSVPSTTASRPFGLVDNNESLLDVSDLVFVDAVGAGLSTAIAPFSNRDFWGVDVDAALFRDFIHRWLDVNGRRASPKFIFGESYGGPRAAVLVPLLQAAGTRVDGVVLQAPALDYNSNCGVVGSPTISCAGYFPSYAAVALHLQRSTQPAASVPAFVDDARNFSVQRYAPSVRQVLAGASVPAELLPLLTAYTGLAGAHWQAQYNLAPDTYMRRLIEGTLLGRYDGRITAPLGSALAAGGDPSSALITASFVTAIDDELRNRLRYTYNATYVTLSNAIQSWDFRHGGRELPDTVPDLASALAQDPQLRVLTINGLHDLATPFHQTELDLARLNAGARVLVRNHVGGHMTYLDDSSRAAQKADLVAFVRGQQVLRQALGVGPAERAPKAVVAIDRAGDLQAAARAPPLQEPAVQAPLRDPWVPPRPR